MPSNLLPRRYRHQFRQENSGYLIRRQHGPMESFEKEYYDLVRSAFLKYRYELGDILNEKDGRLIDT